MHVLAACVRRRGRSSFAPGSGVLPRGGRRRRGRNPDARGAASGRARGAVHHGRRHRSAWRSAAAPSRPRAAAAWARAALAAAAAPPHGPPRTPGWAPTQRSGRARGAGRRFRPLPPADPRAARFPRLLRGRVAECARDPPGRGPESTPPAAGGAGFVCFDELSCCSDTTHLPPLRSPFLTGGKDKPAPRKPEADDSHTTNIWVLPSRAGSGDGLIYSS